MLWFVETCSQRSSDSCISLLPLSVYPEPLQKKQMKLTMNHKYVLKWIQQFSWNHSLLNALNLLTVQFLILCRYIFKWIDYLILIIIIENELILKYRLLFSFFFFSIRFYMVLQSTLGLFRYRYVRKHWNNRHQPLLSPQVGLCWFLQEKAAGKEKGLNKYKVKYEYSFFFNKDVKILGLLLVF